MRFSLAVQRRRGISKTVVSVLLTIAIAVVSCLRIPGQDSMQKILWTAMAVVGMVQIGSSIFDWRVPDWLKPKSEQALYLLIWMFVPFGLISIYSVVYCTLVGDQIGTTVQSITTTGYIFVDVFMAAFLLNAFGRNAIRLLSIAVILSYGCTFVIASLQVGAGNILAELQKSGVKNLFESHDVGVAVVPLVMAHLFIIMREGKERPNRMVDAFILVGLFIVLILCGKRSAYLSLCVGTLVALFLYVTRKVSFPWMTALCIMGFMVCFLYVVFIHTGLLDILKDGFGTLSDRYYVWKWFDAQYTLLPTYLGKGLGYVHRYMINGIGPGLVTVYGYLHNSVLQIYIEAGFIGFMIWFGVYFGVLPRKARLIGGEWLRGFVVINMLAMAAMFTIDNTLTYPVYQVSLMVSMGAVLMQESSEKPQVAKREIVKCE